jgi:hypothetical protein
MRLKNLTVLAIMLSSLFACKKMETAQPAVTTPIVAEGKQLSNGTQKQGRGPLFVGAAPSDEEMDQFRPMVSPAGMANRNINNKLGMWLWYLGGTGYSTHAALADKLKTLDVKRIYVKVADGGYSPTAWPENDDVSLVNAYKSRGIEVWGWAYNYPGNEVNQAKALYQAAKAGYQGFVTDIEIEFDGATTSLESLLAEFVRQKNAAVSAGLATSAFKFYCTTWGNPKDHGMRVDLIDKYVDAHMPQTYVEVWGSTYMANAAQWVNAGTQEYRQMGAKKPIHHIASAEYNVITATQLNSFINASGGETSIWRVPGGSTPVSIWNTLAGVNWGADFGSATGQVTVNVPGFIQANTTTSFTGTATGTVTKVQAAVDGFSLGAPVNVVNGTYTINYTFNTAGSNRNLVVTGLNSSNTAVTSVSRAITVNPNSNFLTTTVPATIRVGVPVRFAGTASSDIRVVKVYADGFYMGESTTSGGLWSLQYTFNTAGSNRQLQLRGFNAANTQIATNTYTINVLANTQYVTGVPYFYQYSNSIAPAGSCQNTTIAMIMKYHAIREGKPSTVVNAITPDDISNYWGTVKAQTVPGYEDLFNREAAFRGLAVRDRGSATATFTKVRDLLAQGKPVVVHGYMTPPGHVVVVLGFDGTHYYCNDPAGKWNQIYQGSGYSGVNATEGIAIKYTKAAFEAAVSPDGLVWLHEFYTP